MKTKDLLIGLGTGLIAGAVIGILFAPHKGKVTRRKIKNQTEDYTDAVREKFSDFVETITGKFESLSKEISDYTDSIKSKIGDLRKTKKVTMN